MQILRKLVLFGCVLLLAAGTLLAANPKVDDPFGTAPKKGAAGCSPEDRYKFSVTLESKKDFVRFLRENTLERVELTNFKKDGLTDWDKVLKKVRARKTGARTIYALRYNPHPGQCSKFTVKMTDDGYVSVYGCCGK